MVALNLRTVRIARRNFEIAYPSLLEEERAQLIRQTLLEQGALSAEMGHVWRRSHTYVRSLISVTGGEHVDQALANGRGLVVLAPHLGNWEVLSHHLTSLGELMCLFEPPKLPAIGDLVLAARQRAGGEYVPTTGRGIAKLVRHCKAGGITGILPDQVPDRDVGAMNVPFMGVDCSTASLAVSLIQRLAVSLIQRSGARAVMGVAWRTRNGFEIQFCPVSDAIYSDDLESALTAMNSDIEQLLSADTTQYQWTYKRFRTTPRSLANHYLGTKG
jgi:KDO2-lipid IV(A) lauroyltransferase